MRKRKGAKFLSGLLAMAMLICTLSMTALADEVNSGIQNDSEVTELDNSQSGNSSANSAEGTGEGAAVLNAQPKEGTVNPETVPSDSLSDTQPPNEGIENSEIPSNEGMENTVDVITPTADDAEMADENAAEPVALAETEEGIATQAAGPKITYSGHVQNIGDQAYVSDGELCGTEGRSLRIEALTIQKGEGIADIDGDITYRAHVQNYGTMGWMKSGQTAGTSNQSLRVEAIQIALTGELAQIYDIYYSTHVQNIGWMKWTKGSTERSGWCGTMGQGLRVEAVKIMLVEKGVPAPYGGGNYSFISYDSFGDVEYTTHQQNIGDHAWVKNQEESGATGQFLRLEAMRIKLSNTMYSGSVQYRAHVQNIGWMDWVSDGAMSGTNGQGLRMEAVQIQLAGDIANYCDIWYRVHVQDIGWMGWAVNGQAAGTESLGRRVESLQVVLVPKGFKGPGENKNYWQQFSSQEMYQAWLMAQNMSSRTNYLILVNNAACRVMIFQGSRGNWAPLHDWVCSPGKPSTPTVRGYYTVGYRGTHFGEDKGYTCYYWTQFYGDYLFHSILYYPYSMRVQEGILGQQLSHGCVRLSIENARWIYDNIPSGTLVYSY